MKFSIKKFTVRLLKGIGIVVGSLLLLMFLIPALFPQTINRKINEWANKNINGNISFTNTSLSFFKQFPALTLTMYNVALKGSAPFEKDTLIAAKEISLGIDISSVFKSKVTINKILLNEAFVNIQVDSAGQPNYNIYKQKKQNTTAKEDTTGASLGINSIEVKNSRIVYDDRSIPMIINARGFNYSGSGDLNKDIFQLNTHTDIASFDFYYGNQPYILSKKINANLVTEINTKSLAFVFQKNDLKINELPVQFSGRFGFLDDGYDMDFKIDSHENDLDEIITALPSAYSQLFDKTELDGTGNVQISLTGKYIAKDKIAPDLNMSLKVRNGYIANDKSPFPVRNLYIDMESKLPGLNTDSLTVNIDSLFFNIGDGYFSSVFRLKGLTVPNIYARINSEIDLEKWNRALGIKPIDVKGKYSLHLLAEGKYATGIKHSGLRKTDTVITSIPKFTLNSSFRGGYFKYASLPQAVKNISFNLHADCPDNNYKHISVALDSLNATALDNYIKGYFKLGNAGDFPIDAMLQAKFHMEDLKQFLPIDGLEAKGDLNVDVQSHGKYQPSKKKFPVTVAHINLQNGSIKTKYYPHPIEDIQISTDITDPTGSLKGMTVSVKPISFAFENEPFLLKAYLHDFTDLQYKIGLQGNLNIGRIYKVFARKGYDVTGSIAAHLSLKGRQSDITAHRYDNLSNKGSLTVNEISFSSDLYPKPFLISRGIFSFNQDKMRFDTFVVKYAHSTMSLNGSVSNIIDYIMKPSAILKGDFSLNSNLIVVDDFMAFSTTAPSAAAAPVQKASGSSSGVVMIPKNLDLSFTANVKKVKYNGMVIKDAKGQMVINHDSLLLKETGFNLIGAPIAMDASYVCINPTKAFFTYHISAKDFDVKKAYKNIKLFRDIATSAAHAEGLISLDYQLKGDLDANMQPVYASLKGGGVLSAEKVRMSGFKLFNAIGKHTNQDSVGGNPDVSKISIKTTIANSIITIERTKIRIAGFRARLEGQVGFDKALNLKFRLGLPPLGLIGIPLAITGTEDNPKIHTGKGKEADELQGTNDSDE